MYFGSIFSSVLFVLCKIIIDKFSFFGSVLVCPLKLYNFDYKNIRSYGAYRLVQKVHSVEQRVFKIK